jgi:cell division septation protein DedD
MLVTCPNCHRRGLIDADSPHDEPSHAVCPRCDEPFRAVPSRFDSSAVVIAATAAKREPAVAPSLFVTGREAAPHAAPRAFIAAAPRATTRDEDADVLLRFEAPPASPGDAACGLLDLGEGPLDLGEALFAREPRARPRAAADNYGRAVRLMNVSPLWLLAACAGFFALVFAFDLMLTPARRVGTEADALAALNNQATNRDTARRARAADADLSEESTDDEARTGYDEGAPSGAQADPIAPKPAPVSDAARDEVKTQPGGGGVSFENARAELRADAGGKTQSSTITIQLGSFRVASEAEAQVDALRADGFDARVFEEQNSKRPWYRVQTGLFGAREEAVRHLAALRAKGFAADYTLREMRGEADSR